MALATLRLNLGDTTGPGRVGEILIRPLSSSNDTSIWQSTKAARLPLKYSDPVHAPTDPAYSPEYTLLDGTKYPKVTQGAQYEFTVVRVNNTKDGTIFTAVIPASASVDFDDLTPTVPIPPSPATAYSTSQVDTFLSGKQNVSSLNADVAAKVAASGATQTAVDTRVTTLAARINYVRDIREFLTGSETLDRTGATSMSTIFQRAVDTLTAEYAAHTTAFGQVGFQIYVPDGYYKFSTALVWKTGVGIKGESRLGTVMLPVGGQAFIGQTYPGGGYSYDDCHFNDFTVDGYQQTNATYTTSIKGFFIQHMKRPRWERVTVRNTWATGFGIDHLTDWYISDCDAINCGRGVTELGIDPATTSGASGFGIGSGATTMEEGTIINCRAIGNALYGFFTEKQNSETYYSQGFKMTGCHAEGNWIGLKDCGSSGAAIYGNHLVNNKLAGFALDQTILATNGAGSDGLFTGNVITGNGTAPGSLEACGVLFGKASRGGYDIRNNVIRGNLGPGMLAPVGASLAERIVIHDNHIFGNVGDGISVRVAASRIRIGHNFTHDNTGTGIYFKGSSITSEGVVLRDNDCEDGIAIEHTMTGRYVSDGNIASVDIPSGLAATTTTTTTVTLVASPPARSAGITDYTWQYQTSPGGTWTAFTHTASAVPSITITGLTNGQLYAFRVAAVSAAGTSAWSGLAYGTPGLMARIADDFNRPDSVIAGSTASKGSSSALWVATQASGSSTVVGVVGGFLKAISGTGNTFSTVSGTSTGRVQATMAFLRTTPTQRRAGIVFRYLDALNYWLIAPDLVTGGKWRLVKVVAGTATVVNSSALEAATGDVITVDFSSTTNAISWTVAGVAQTSTTDSALSAQTGVGFRGDFQDISSKWDDFKFFDLS